MKDLSIIIPVYNVERYIEQCLDSIVSQNQNIISYEVIIVNDGTKDNSMQIVQGFLDRLPLIIVNQKNQGLSVARNNGLSHSSGQYIWFVDSDDWLMQDAFVDIKNVLTSNGDVDVISTILEEYHEKNNTFVKEYNPRSGVISGKDYIMRGYRHGASQRFIFKKSFLDKYSLKFTPGIIHEDSMFGYVMLYRAKKIFISKTPIYYYRIREMGSIMSSITVKSPRNLLFIHKTLKDFAANNVMESDMSWYTKAIYSNIDCIFGFSRSILYTREFNEFWKENKKYIKSETKFLLKEKETFLYGLRMMYFPRQYMYVRYLIRRFLDQFKN